MAKAKKKAPKKGVDVAIVVAPAGKMGGGKKPPMPPMMKGKGKSGKCPECGGKMTNGVCEDCGYTSK
jgi:hypothetical protein